jgi:hypothetical protein
MGIQFYSGGDNPWKTIQLSRDTRNELYFSENWKGMELADYEMNDEDGVHTIQAVHLTDYSFRWSLLEGVLTTALSLARGHNNNGHPEKAIEEIAILSRLSSMLSDINIDAFTMD